MEQPIPVTEATPATKRTRKGKRKPRATTPPDPSRPRVERFSIRRWAEKRGQYHAKALDVAPILLTAQLRESLRGAGRVDAARSRLERAAKAPTVAEDALKSAEANIARNVEAVRRFDALAKAIADAANVADADLAT